MHDYSAQALDAPAAESWVDCKKTGNVWQQKGRSLGVLPFFKQALVILFFEKKSIKRNFRGKASALPVSV